MSGTIQTNLFSHTISDCLFEIYADHLVLTKGKDLSDAPLFCATRWTFNCTCLYYYLSWVSLHNEIIETFPLHYGNQSLIADIVITNRSKIKDPYRSVFKHFTNLVPSILKFNYQFCCA